MRNRLIVLVCALALGGLFASSAFAQSTATPVVPGYNSTTGCTSGLTVCFLQYGPGFNASGQTTLAVTTSSSRVALPSSGPTVVVSNGGAVTAYVVLGNSSVVATTAGTPVLPGYPIVLQAGSNTYLAAITASGSTTLTITTGSGIPQSAGGIVIATDPTPVTPSACTATTIVTGGTAVTILSGPTTNTTTLMNPPNLSSQGIAAAENLYIDEVGTPGSTDAAAHGTTFIVVPGQPYNIAPLKAGAVVKANAATNGHLFSCVARAS